MMKILLLNAKKVIKELYVKHVFLIKRTSTYEMETMGVENVQTS